MTKNDIANALVQAQAIVPPVQAMPPMAGIPQSGDMPMPPAATQNPFMVDPALEQAAAPNRAPTHPLVQAMMAHLGLLGMIRNQSNAPFAAGENP